MWKWARSQQLLLSTIGAAAKSCDSRGVTLTHHRTCGGQGLSRRFHDAATLPHSCETRCGNGCRQTIISTAVVFSAAGAHHRRAGVPILAGDGLSPGPVDSSCRPLYWGRYDPASSLLYGGPRASRRDPPLYRQHELPILLLPPWVRIIKRINIAVSCWESSLVLSLPPLCVLRMVLQLASRSALHPQRVR